jgi:hypothetical protein
MTAQEWVWVDKHGKSRDYFKTRTEAVEALRDEDAECPEIAAGSMLVAYDESGEEVGDPEWVEDLLATPPIPTSALQFVMQGGERVGLFMRVPSEATSGTATPIRRGFRRPPSDAIHTLVSSEA